MGFGVSGFALFPTFVAGRQGHICHVAIDVNWMQYILTLGGCILLQGCQFVQCTLIQSFSFQSRAVLWMEHWIVYPLFFLLQYSEGPTCSPKPDANHGVSRGLLRFWCDSQVYDPDEIPALRTRKGMFQKQYKQYPTIPAFHDGVHNTRDAKQFPIPSITVKPPSP